MKNEIKLIIDYLKFQLEVEQKEHSILVNALSKSPTAKLNIELYSCIKNIETLNATLKFILDNIEVSE